MKDHDRVAGERRTAGPSSRLFTVRLWKEEAANGAGYRGSVREVVSGAFHGFRDWSDLAAFMIARLQEDEPEGRGQTETSEDEKRRRR